MIDDKKNEKLGSAAQDPSRRAAIGAGLAAAIAVLAKWATSPALAETKTNTKYTKYKRALPKTGTDYKKTLPKTNTKYDRSLPRLKNRT